MRYKTILNAKLLAVFLFLLALTSTSLSAQNRHLTGNISDANGPIPGASVILKGTTTGTVSDEKGDFAFDVNSTNPVVVVSFVGYASQEIVVGDQSVLNLILTEDASTLNEVVVTGYGTDGTKRQNTGSVSTIKARDLKAIPSGDVEQQLQGRVSGVTVITNGQPGTASIIRVHGFGSFAGNEPLYIIDGVPSGSTNFLAPDDIETVTVLKDAAAASIYGSRASSGVIVYTTKRGTKKSKKLEVSYDGLYGFTSPGNSPDVMNPTDFLQWTWQAQHNTAVANKTTLDASPYTHPQFGTFTESNHGTLPDYINVGGSAGVTGSVDLTALASKYNVDPTKGNIYQVVKANKAGTDWYSAITRNAPLQRHNLGFSGGSENSRFYVGLGAQNQDGILKNNKFTRYDFRVNSEFDLTSKLRIGENLQFTYRSVLGQGGANNGRGVAADENDINESYRMPSIIPVYDEYGGYAGTAAKGFNNPRNPVASRDGQVNDYNFGATAFGNVYAEYDIIPGLMIRSSLGGQSNNYYYKYYSRLQYENSENNSSFGFGEGSGYNLSWTFTNTAEYKKKFGAHDITVLGGIEALNSGSGRDVGGSGINPFSTDPNYPTLSNVSSKAVSSDLYSGYNLYSTFGQVKYAFQDKYYLTGVIRRDGASNFGPNNPYGVFPAISAGWRISGEDFMKNQSLFTDLKLIVGYGQMGNLANISPTNSYSLYGGSLGGSSYDINGTNTSVVTGFNRTQIGNPNGKWETATTSSLGIAGSILTGKFDFTIDFWNKDNSGLLFQVPLPNTVGSATPPYQNVGSMNNKGIDLQIIHRGKINTDWKYEVTVNGSILSNKILAFAPEANVTYLDGVNYRGVTPVRSVVGQSISNFYGYQVVGLFQTQAEVDAAPKQDGAGVGRFRYADTNGDGVIDSKDRTNIGSPVPKFTGGVYLSVNFKGLEIATYLYTSLGNKIFNFSKWYTDFYPSFQGAQISNRVKNSWLPTNTATDIPIFESYSGFSSNSQSNSWYVEDGSYLRMQNLAINYNLPSDILKPLGIKRAKIGVSTNNIFTITGYKGLDPGVGGAADTNYGVDIGNYPVTRSYLVNVSVGF